MEKEELIEVSTEYSKALPAIGRDTVLGPVGARCRGAETPTSAMYHSTADL